MCIYVDISEYVHICIYTMSMADSNPSLSDANDALGVPVLSEYVYVYICVYKSIHEYKHMQVNTRI